MSHEPEQSVRSKILIRSKYNRPLDEQGTRFETWDQTTDRVIDHQQWLWERAQGGELTQEQRDELASLRRLIVGRRSLPAGRILWMGGTEVIRNRESAAFNCAGTEVSTIHDVVDVFWLLLQGAGVGFRPMPGKLTGFYRKLEVEVIRSERTTKGGDENNSESWVSTDKVWTIRIGDSAEAWAKSIGKVLYHPYPARKLVLDLSQLRPSGIRLRGYGWVSSGDAYLAEAYKAIAMVLNKRAGRLLTKEDIWDIINWLGTVLSSRRSAQIGLIEDGDPETDSIARRKYPGFDKGPDWYRGQSNNTRLFYQKPTRRRLKHTFEEMAANGGSEMGFLNMEAALRRAPWCRTVNPCVTGDTWVQTSDGPQQVQDLIRRQFRAFVDGELHSSTSHGFFPTGEKMVYRVETDRGFSFQCTEDHPIQEIYELAQHKRKTRWRNLSELTIGDRISLHNHRAATWEGCGTFAQGWLVGSLLGDGTFATLGCGSRSAKLTFWGESKDEMREKAAEMLRTAVHARTDCGLLSPGGGTAIVEKHDKVNISSVGLRGLAESYGVTVEKTIGPRLEQTSSAFHAGFLRGWFDADGSVQGSQAKGVSVRLVSVSLPNLLVAQRMLARLGIISTIYSCRHPEGYRDLPDGNGGLASYWCQKSHELVVANDNVRVFRDVVGFHEPVKAERLDVTLASYVRKLNRERFVAKITSIEPVGVRPVYDCTIPSAGQFDGNGVNLHNCGEVLLGAFCNLTETDVAKYRDDDRGLLDSLHLIARANYRQTCVNLRDGILQSHWHEQNEYLRLCGVGLCGVVRRPDLTPYDYRQMKYAAVAGAYSMADELGTPRPKNTTLIKPGGTVPKCLDTTEGIKRPDGRFILNRVNFRRDDPIVARLLDAGYKTESHSSMSDSCLVVIPYEYDDVQFGIAPDGTPINTESVVEQLERYRLIMDHYCEQNASTTVMWSPSEIPAMVNWFDRYWDHVVGVSFLFRNDHTVTAEQLGFAYLPQSVVNEVEFRRYTEGIKPVDLADIGDAGTFDAMEDQDCRAGMCPVR